MDVTDVILTVNGGDEISRAVADSPALLGFETGRYRPPEDLVVDFCDWPFTDPDVSLDDHVTVVRNERPKYAVAPDVEAEWTLRDVLSVARELDRFAENVIIVPKDCRPGEIPEKYVIGYPNQPNFGSNGAWMRNSYPSDHPVHVLGGSPDDQLDLADYLTVRSVDGANVTRYAEFGRVWTPGPQLERPDLSYYERIRESLGNIHAMWNMGQSSGSGDPELETAEQTTLVQADGGRNDCTVNSGNEQSEGDG